MGESPEGMEAAGEQQRVPRFRPGFPWGLAAGTLAAVLIVVAGVVVLQIVALSRFGARSGPATQVVVSPVKAGKDWFSVAANGSGTLQGWTVGASGTGDNKVSGAVAFFDVGTVDSVDGALITHSVHVYVTRSTQILVGGQPYNKGSAGSPAEAIFNGEDGTQVLDSRLLTIEFHRVGQSIVADRISAPLEIHRSPVQSY